MTCETAFWRRASFFGIDTRQGAGVHQRGDPDARFELVVGNLPESGRIVELIVVGICEEDFLLIRQFKEGDGMASHLHDAAVERAHKLLGGGGGFN